MSEHRSNDMNSQPIPNGTEFSYPNAPDEQWRVEDYLGEREDEDGTYAVYRCRMIAGDTGQYAADRNEDGTIDLVGETIVAALEGDRA